MLLFKYRDLSVDVNDSLARLQQILRAQAFWAANADSLNDPQEFFWDVDYFPSSNTITYLAVALSRHRGWESEEAQKIATHAVRQERVEVFAAPIVDALQHRFREEIGLVCFGRSPDNPTLWERYAASGYGVCVQLEVPDNLMSKQLHDVKYVDDKTLHVDNFLQASGELGAGPLYEMALLTKPSAWADEEEIRFVSKKHSVPIRLRNSRVTKLVIGDKLPLEVRSKLERLVADLPYALPLAQREA